MKFAPISPALTRPSSVMIDAVAAEFRQLSWPERSVGFALLWRDFESSPAAWRTILTGVFEHLGVGAPDCADAAAWMTVSHHSDWITAGGRWAVNHRRTMAQFERRLPPFPKIRSAIVDDILSRRESGAPQEVLPDVPFKRDTLCPLYSLIGGTTPDRAEGVRGPILGRRSGKSRV